MQHTLFIEIDEVETEVRVEFTSNFGEVEIQTITDVVSNDNICPDLLDGQMTKIGVERLYDELREVAAYAEYIPTENINHYNY